MSTLCSLTREGRQTLLFSATFPDEIAPLAASLQSKPLRLRVGARGSPPLLAHASAAAGDSSAVGGGGAGQRGEDDAPRAEDEGEEEGEEGRHVEAPTQALLDSLPAVPPSVTQEVTLCATHKKPRRLLKLMSQLLGPGVVTDGKRPPPAESKEERARGAAKERAGGQEGRHRERRVLLFANKIKTAAFVTQLLCRHGVTAEALSSRLSQPQRESILSRFARGELPVLVATDVAARGIHIDGLRHVVNWDFGARPPTGHAQPSPARRASAA